MQREFRVAATFERAGPLPGVGKDPQDPVQTRVVERGAATGCNHPRTSTGKRFCAERKCDCAIGAKGRRTGGKDFFLAAVH